MTEQTTLSTDQLLEKTEIGTAKTLTRWHQAGLIPPPVRVQHPGGRGKTGAWPAWVPYRIKKVTSLQAQGYGLDEIAAILGQDWEAEREAFERERKGISRGLPSVPEMIAGNLAMAVSFKVGGVLGEGPGRPESKATIAVRTALGKKETIKRAVSLLQEGYHPVAVFDGTTVSVLPDIAVGLKVSSLSASDDGALVVVSLLPELAEHCEEHGVQFPRTRAFPAPKAWIKDEQGNTAECEFLATGPLGVELVRETGKAIGRTPATEPKTPTKSMGAKGAKKPQAKAKGKNAGGKRE